MVGTAERGVRVASDPSTAIVETVTAEGGREPTETPEPLSDHVDPDALERLMRSMDDGAVQFSDPGYRVTVDADGAVEVSNRKHHR